MPSRRGAQLLVTLVLMLAALGLAACTRCEKDAPVPAASSSAHEKLVPAPAGLAMMLSVPSPKQSYGALSRLSEMGGVLPRSAELAFTRLLQLPLQAAGNIDVERPATLMLLEQAGTMTLVGTMRLRSEREFKALLTTGPNPEYRVDESSLALLTPREPGRPTFALLDGALVAGSSAEAVRSAATYLVQESKTAKGSPDAMTAWAPKSALKGPLSRWVERVWGNQRAELDRARAAAEREQGRPADFADPGAALTAIGSGVDAVMALLQTSEKLSAELLPGTESVRLRATLDPTPGGNADEVLSGMTMGSLEPMLGLPAETGVVLISYSSRKERERSAAEVGAQLRALLGERVSAEEHEKLQITLQHWAEARGDRTLAALKVGDGLGLYVDAELRDPERAALFATTLANVLAIRALFAPLESLVGGPLRPHRTSATVSETAFDGRRFALPKATGQALEVDAIELLWGSSKTSLRLMLAAAPAAASLEAFMTPQRRLAQAPDTAALLKEVGTASWAVLAQPEQLGVAGHTPLLLAVGRRGKQGTLSMELPPQLLQTLASVLLTP